jgi:hypothetical protein
MIWMLMIKQEKLTTPALKPVIDVFISSTMQIEKSATGVGCRDRESTGLKDGGESCPLLRYKSRYTIIT